MKSDRALKAALRVFALQWLPIVNSEEAHWTAFNDTSIANPHEETQHRKGFCQVYKDAWHQARLLINEASSVRSFRVVFATFLFDGTVLRTDLRHAYYVCAVFMLRRIGQNIWNPTFVCS